MGAAGCKFRNSCPHHQQSSDDGCQRVRSPTVRERKTRKRMARNERRVLLPHANRHWRRSALLAIGFLIHARLSLTTCDSITSHVSSSVSLISFFFLGGYCKDAGTEGRGNRVGKRYAWGSVGGTWHGHHHLHRRRG